MAEGQKEHKSVMLAEILEYLQPCGCERILDGTLGLGGHAGAILASCGQCQLCGLDRDSEALGIARSRLEKFGDRTHLFHLRFSDFASALSELGWSGVSGCLLDLGVSSLQLDSPERGFSFRQDGPLDMRMDGESLERGAQWLVNQGTFSELRDCLATLGEEPQAGRIARRIIEERQKKPIRTTTELADLVWQAYPPKWRRSSRRHPATRTFQALRMAVNGELEQLESFLAAIPDWLLSGGRIVIISFHSLEDRLVKRAFRSWTDAGRARLLLKKPLVPSEAEIIANPRASSAKLRAAEII